jgi:hypothetical protein
LAGIDQDVVGEVKFPKEADSAKEVGAEEELVVGFVLNDMADANELRVAGESFEIRGDMGGTEVDPAYDPEHPGSGVREPQEPVGLGDGLTGLDGDGAIESEWALETFEICWKPVLMERGSGGDPGILGGTVAPEMLVGIDVHGGVTCGWRCVRGPSPSRWSG